MRTTLLAAAMSVGLASSATALQFSRVPLQGGGIVIQATGPIIAGDMERLEAFLHSLPVTDRVFGYALDSPGGDVGEAEKFANFVHQLDTTVGVLRGSKCASACFLVFAAASRKLAAPDALIGVHSASDAGTGDETLGSLATTTLMSRDLAGFGVPSTIIGKVVATEPGRMEWLLPSDLALMGVEVTGLERATRPPNQPAQSPPPTQPVLPAPVGVTLEQAAQRFLASYFGNWSANNSAAMAYVSGVYAPQVDFYGTATSRQTIVDLKRKFTERWPDRLYTVRPDSVGIVCDHQASTCVVSGLVDWDCRSTARSAHSTGLANFTVRVAFSNTGLATVVSEMGSVVARASAQ
jgi:hypothetical protein